MFGSRFKDRQQRREQLRKMFAAQREEFTEDNLPTNIAVFFEDVIASLPEEARECNIEGLFDNALEEKQMQQERKPPSAHSVRFSLLSQKNAKYALVFKELGYEPSDEQKSTLGRQEYYEEVLQELLLPENIDTLIAAMNKAGIDIELLF